MIISFSNFKGGVLKTTSTINIGASLARSGKRVLLIDLDPQFNLTQSLKVPDKVTSIYNVLTGRAAPECYEQSERLFILPSAFDLVQAETELAGQFRREYLLEGVVKTLRHEYDYILIDCPPSLGLLTINALVASDLTFVPVAAEYLALQGFTYLAKAMGNINMEVDRVFVTKYDHRKVINRSVKDSLYRSIGEKMFQTVIRDNIALAEAPTAGLSIFDYAPRSNGAVDFESLTNEILKI